MTHLEGYLLHLFTAHVVDLWRVRSCHCCVLPTPSEMLQVQGMNMKEMKLLGAMRLVRTEEEPRRYSNDFVCKGLPASMCVHASH